MYGNCTVKKWSIVCRGCSGRLEVYDSRPDYLEGYDTIWVEPCKDCPTMSLKDAVETVRRSIEHQDEHGPLDLRDPRVRTAFTRLVNAAESCLA